LPKEKIKIFDQIDDSHIPYVSEEEKIEIEEILKNQYTRIIVKSMTIDL